MSTELVSDVNVAVVEVGCDEEQVNIEGGESTAIGRNGVKPQQLYRLDSVENALERLVAARWASSEEAVKVNSSRIIPTIGEGDRVVIKPNWVYHENQAGFGLDCLVTHANLILSVIRMVKRSRPSTIVVGDAPIQGCDLSRLFKNGQFGTISDELSRGGVPGHIVDFRRAVLKNAQGIWEREKNARSEAQYTLVDMGKESLLEEISRDAKRFRVTMYDPRAMHNTHRVGRHQYLVAKEVLDADVVINMPKLKTHKKACVTGALKNLVGINGHKDYLPHHRRGGSHSGGDCYEGSSFFKDAAERLYDIANQQEGLGGYISRQMARLSFACGVVTGGGRNLEGSWYGNDTIWRTCLDLNRALIYAGRDGVLCAKPQRKVLTITDAVLCGEGEGPLAPTPRALKSLTMAQNPAAADYVHAYLMGFDWQKIPIIREAFRAMSYPICTFAPSDVKITKLGKELTQPWCEREERFRPPLGWNGHC